MNASSIRFKSLAVTAGLSFWFFIITSSLGYFSIEIFLGALFVLVISIYGILFKFLKIDLLRLKEQPDSYWLDIEETKDNRIGKQY